MTWNHWSELVGLFSNRKVGEIGFMPFLAVVGISLLCALFISLLYRHFYAARATGSRVHHAFPLLSISVTAIFLCIQFSLPLSLGLLGALSIVRFRTPIKEPEEIGFIMLVISTALCCATFNLLFLGVILVSAVVALLIQRYAKGFFKGNLNDGMLVITLPLATYRNVKKDLFDFLEREVPRGRVDGVTETAGEACISYGFAGLDRANLLKLDGLKDIAAEARSNIFFNRSGEV